MKFNDLKVKGQKRAHRVGRGISAGGGKTAGRGTKGQGARKSGGVRPGFEGGQMPVYMRLPMLRGFKSRKPPTENVFTGQLDKIKGSLIDNQALFEARLTSSPHVGVKLIVKGELKSKKNVKIQSASRLAIDMLKQAGGSFEKVDRIARVSKHQKASK